MYYKKEKTILVTLICLILVYTFYSLYIYFKYISVNPEIINNFKFWGKTFFIFIPIIIISQIIVHIVFSIINKIITNEDIPTISDEMDKLIELKSLKISHWAYSLGFILAMGSQAIGMQPWVMFIILIFSCFLSSIISEIVKIYFYRKGI